MNDHKNIKLTKRLSAVAELAGKGNILADIGTDHAYVPLYLVKNGCYRKAFACDIKEGPVKRAKANIKKYHMEDKIFSLQCDGIDQTYLKDCDLFIIAGMGGELISRIIGDADILKSQTKRLVLQPMSKKYLLRKFLSQNYFQIMDEAIVKEGNKFYTLLSAGYGETKVLSDLECLLGPLLMREKNDLFYDYVFSIYTPMKLAADHARKGMIQKQDGILESLLKELYALLQEGGRL